MTNPHEPGNFVYKGRAYEAEKNIKAAAGEYRKALEILMKKTN